MTEYRHRVRANGRYQLVALSPEPHYQPTATARYAVTTLAGAILHRDLSLEDASITLEVLAHDDAIATDPPARIRRPVPR